jgi:hypothetical protein
MYAVAAGQEDLGVFYKTVRNRGSDGGVVQDVSGNTLSDRIELFLAPVRKV